MKTFKFVIGIAFGIIVIFGFLTIENLLKKLVFLKEEEAKLRKTKSQSNIEKKATSNEVWTAYLHDN